MADRYWVGGAGTWDTASTTHWSATSGGGAGASAPTSADNVFFNASSGLPATITVGFGASCANFVVSGTGATFNGSDISVYGTTFTVAAGNTFTNILYLSTPAGTVTINVSPTLPELYLFGAATFVLAANLTVTTMNVTSNAVFSTSATNYALTVNYRFIVDSGSTVNFNASTINHYVTTTGSGGASFTFATGSTLNAGTSFIYLSGTLLQNINVDFGGSSVYRLYILSHSSVFSVFLYEGIYLFGSSSLTVNNNLTIGTQSQFGAAQIFFPSTVTVSGTFSSTGLNQPSRIFLTGPRYGDAFGNNSLTTITATTVGTLAYTDFYGVTASGATWTGTNLGNAGNNSNITFAAGLNKYWNSVANTAYFYLSNWALTNGGATNVANFPLPQDTVIFTDTGAPSNVTFYFGDLNRLGYVIGNIDFSSRTLAFRARFDFGNYPLSYIVGNYTGSTAVTYNVGGSKIGFTIYNNNPSTTITPNLGSNYFCNIDIRSGVNGGAQITGNAATIGSGAAASSNAKLTLYSGSFDTTLFDLTVDGVFSSSPAGLTTLYIGTKNIYIPFAGYAAFSLAVWDVSNSYFSVSGTGIVYVNSSTTNTLYIRNTGGTSTAFNLAIPRASANVTQITGYFKTLNFLSFTGTLQPYLSTAFIQIAGNLTISASMYFASFTSSQSFNLTATGTITTNNNPQNIPSIRLSTVGAIYDLVGTLNLSTTVGGLYIDGGTFNSSNYAIQTPTFQSNTSNTRAINLGTSAVSVSGSLTTNAVLVTSTGLTLSAASSTFNISMLSGNKTFAGGGLTWGLLNITNASSSRSFNITGSNTFSDITASSITTALNLFFGSATTTTVSNFSLSGTSGNLVYIDTATGTFTLSKASGGVSVSYMSVHNSNATGGATWRAPLSLGNIDAGNNTGWTFPPFAIYDVSVTETSSCVETVSARQWYASTVTNTASGVDSIRGNTPINVTTTESTSAIDSNSALSKFISAVSETGAGAAVFSTNQYFFSTLVELASGLDTVSMLFIWTPVDDGQLPAWQLVSDNQTASWTTTSNEQTATWQSVTDSQTVNWGNADNSQTLAWEDVLNNVTSSWGTVSNTQATNWQNTNNTQTASWGDVSDNQTVNWQNVDNAQTAGLSSVTNVQTPNWTEIT